MAISAADVKTLRSLTDAPMMECKAALEEAGGDMERAKDILREKGKAAATKRADRSTSEGVVAIATAGNKLGAVVVECETDFVANNQDFIALVQEMAEVVMNSASTEQAATDPSAVTDASGKSLAQYCEDAVAKIRENIVVKRALKLEGGNYASYVHHDRKKAAVVELASAPSQDLKDLAIQIVALNPQFIYKDELSQEVLDKEIELQTKRAIEEGKDEKMAENIARGRVNKEYVKEVVLSEQSYFRDTSKSVGQYIQEQGGNVKVLAMHKLYVGG